MGKAVKGRRKFRENWDFNTNRFRKKFLLLKHLRDTRFKISDTMALALMDEETRNREAILNDLEPVVIPHSVYGPGVKKSVKTSRTNSESSSSLPQAFIPANLSLNTSLITDQTRGSNTATRSGSIEMCPAHVEYTLPTISELEETGLKEFYNSFLNSATWQISNLNVRPGDDHFIFWFMASSYIPLICSCSGPLSNLFSLLAIICPWKINKHNPSFEHDPFWCYLVNSISIVFALISNIFLLLNYRKKIRYTYCQVISISGWAIACVILTVLIVVYHVWFYRYHYDEDYIIGEGFWFAIITVTLHFTNFLMLLLNELGFLLKKYKPVFNIDQVQETLIIQTTAMAVWLIIGASILTRLINLGLGDSLYYCIVSVVTIGEQDVVSTTDVAAQTVSAIWIVFGLVMFGLIVTSIRKMMIDFSSSTLYWHRLERLRRKSLETHQNETRISSTNQESFVLIKNIAKWAYTIQGVAELTTSIIIFMFTLMVGAMALSILESWPYKTTVYFCFFNLMTLGQGTEAPTTPGGKAIFCAWALAAIPVMTILVSTSSDFVFSRLTVWEEVPFSDAVIEYCLSKSFLKSLGYFLKSRQLYALDKASVFEMKNSSMLKVDDTKNHGDDNNNDNVEDYINNNNNNINNNNDNNDKDNTHGNDRDVEMDNTPGIRISEFDRGKHDVFADVPVICHPADMLYNVILDSTGVDNFGFITSRSFVRSNTATIQLANYFREGAYVNPNIDQLHESRQTLGQHFKDLDSKFDVNEYEKAYDIYATGQNHGVIQKDLRIMTGFKKKNDFVLNKLSRIQVILLELRSALHKVCTNLDHEYSYQDWEILFNITQSEEALEDNLYWIESRSPLAFPMHQPKYFTLHYMRHLELFLQQFAAEWDELPIDGENIADDNIVNVDIPEDNSTVHGKKWD